MKYVYIKNSTVVGVAHISDDSTAIVSGPDEAECITVADSVVVSIGYTQTEEGFAPPAYSPNIVSIGRFLSSIQSLEMSRLRASTDPLVQEFVFLCTDPRIVEIDLNEPRVQFDVQYCAGLVIAPAGAANVGQFISTACIGINGDGSARATAILGGNLLAATS